VPKVSDFGSNIVVGLVNTEIHSKETFWGNVVCFFGVFWSLGDYYQWNQFLFLKNQIVPIVADRYQMPLPIIRINLLSVKRSGALASDLY
jgi:hypothetical protein